MQVTKEIPDKTTPQSEDLPNPLWQLDSGDAPEWADPDDSFDPL